MTTAEWRRVKAITIDALEVPELERATFIAGQCGADAALHREVRSLVAATIAATDLFEHPALTTNSLAALIEAQLPASSLIGTRIGPYIVVKELGRGGMGAAFLAERADQAFKKRVAIKLIKRGMDTDAIVRRFLHERQILANLNHPSIATLFDGGTTEDGLPYFVMEYVDGSPIDVYCRHKQLSIADRLKLFRLVCDAVHYAHENLVIHRDLKPANILVTQRGVPKLLDFGVAKLLEPGKDQHTSDGTLLAQAMTPQYASPEQVRGDPITPASDVYSLGVVLYELLTGATPYRFTGRTRLEAERLVCEEIPPPPSARVDADTTSRTGQPSAAVRRQLAGNVDAIVLMAVRKEPQRRYPTAKAFAEDIQRHLDGAPIVARADPLLRRAVRHIARWRVQWAAAAALLIVSIAIGMWRFGRHETARGEITSIVVLPFSTTGSSPDVEYLADGLTESVINRLSRISRLKVIARDSAYRYKDRVVDPQEIGRDLGVQGVVTGRVVHRGANLTLSVELVDTKDRTQRWGEQYTRSTGDVQVLHADLARSIVSGLRLQLSSNERNRLSQNDQRDPQAYELYLRGRYFWNKRTVADFRRSIDYFSKAVSRDPQFALAYSGLADSYSLLTEYHGALARDTHDAAKSAATRALELEPDLAEAHTSLGYIRQFYEWDWIGAEGEFTRALELNPRYATGHQWYAEFLSAMGRPEEALIEIRRAAEVDPISLIVNAVEANILYMARRYDQAVEQCRKVIDMNANFPEVYEYLKRALDQKRLYRDAIAARQMRRKLLRLDAGETEALRVAASTSTPRVYWQKRLEQELEEGKTEGLQPFEMAEILAQAGDTARAVEWLKKACDDNDFMTMYIRVAPNLDPLRADPRFRALVEKGCRI